MQGEVTGKSVVLITDGANMSEQVLEQALQQLAGQNAGLANIEISDKNIIDKIRFYRFVDALSDSGKNRRIIL